MLSNRDFSGVFYRSFFVQTIWNFERMQQVGFAYLLFPLIKKLFPDKASQQKIIQRHLEFFNTHPYLVPLIGGVVIGKEEKGDSPEGILKLKSNLMLPLAAMGDSFFWALWRPFISLIGVIITFLAFLTGKFIIGGILLFLCSYNSVHFWVKWVGFKQGYLLQERIVEKIKKVPIREIMITLRIVGLVLLGIIAGFLCYSESQLFKLAPQQWGVWVVSICLIITIFVGLRKGKKTSWVLMLLMILGSFLVCLQKLGIWEYKRAFFTF